MQRLKINCEADLSDPVIIGGLTKYLAAHPLTADDTILTITDDLTVHRYPEHTKISLPIN